jgi:putative membrane protein
MQRPLQSIKGKRITTYQQVEIDNTLTCVMRWENVNELKHRFPTTYSIYIRFTLCLFIILFVWTN